MWSLPQTKASHISHLQVDCKETKARKASELEEKLQKVYKKDKECTERLFMMSKYLSRRWVVRKD